ncbi:MAG: UDP-N-acetylglucosamine 2-epimerase (non-hydrolyzing) [Candidatus Doudnabacteria bacterium]
MKIGIILGTRPEIIKMSPIIRECQKRKIKFFLLHTNQHYAKNLGEVFFQELKLPKAKYNLKVGSGTHAETTGKMLIRIEKVLLKEKPSIILTEGDTNTVLAAALAVSKLNGIQLGHIEAGLRSYYRQMPEEINRILADHCSDYLFAPTRNAVKTLKSEGIPKEKIFLTGNTIVDALKQNLKIKQGKTEILKSLKIKKGQYILVTVHRQENTDKPLRLKNILQGLQLIYHQFHLPIVYPIHPRTQKMIKFFGLKITPKIKLIPPLGYLNFLLLEKNARLILTDSGGIQEEACILKVPCVTLRDNTERPETLEIGANILSGTEPQKILNCALKMAWRKEKKWRNPFGDGHAGQRILDILLNKR